MSVHKIQKFNYLAHIQLILYLQVRFSTTHLTLTFFFQSLHYFFVVIKLLLLLFFRNVTMHTERLLVLLWSKPAFKGFWVIYLEFMEKLKGILVNFNVPQVRILCSYFYVHLLLFYNKYFLHEFSFASNELAFVLIFIFKVKGRSQTTLTSFLAFLKTYPSSFTLFTL